MVNFFPCKPEHLRSIKVSRLQEEEAAYSIGDPSFVLANGTSLSAWEGEECIGAAGVFIHWHGRGEAWFLCGEDAGMFLRPVIKRMRLVLDTLPLRRIEMTVKVGNSAGHRLASMLDFVAEGTLRNFHVNGDDVVMYSRVKL